MCDERGPLAGTCPNTEESEVERFVAMHDGRRVLRSSPLRLEYDRGRETEPQVCVPHGPGRGRESFLEVLRLGPSHPALRCARSTWSWRRRWRAPSSEGHCPSSSGATAAISLAACWGCAAAVAA